ncbi:NADPH-dependent 1-acyldihydroxyacetone phosphate reductase [Colletotrichum spaethianum]|uniref:NADPH-dependent 1-acyldihydroxyacetone phosphate reductase n=1 Tax=Colletotrichum spaethianum TaxID=700344 RepID=A0AA37NYL3_9PEZI|nr:NADPH-dependent 1-acyldihydroxyacetone phosphate reductase [Colletotrichum spaethianum]GKT46357.1 NADPH-dependent 1-acyldihydroxyacetone phosphate reductase [Colletotrichum spaethianum]
MATARREDVIAELVAEGLDAPQLDVTNEESIAACHKQVQERTGGRPNIVVNNAVPLTWCYFDLYINTSSLSGRIYISPATDLSMSDVRTTFETNVFGIMAMVKALADHIIAARGLIISIFSCAAVTPYVFASAYCLSKCAIMSYSRTLRQELWPFGICVMVTMAGIGKSKIAEKPQPSLMPGSLYEEMGDLYTRYVYLRQEEEVTDTDLFAKELVNHALKSEGRLFGRPN